MKPHRLGAPQALPQTRNDLQLWVREHLELPSHLESRTPRGGGRGLQPARAALAGVEAGSDSGGVGGFSEKMADKTHELHAQGCDASAASRATSSSSSPT